MLKTVVYFHCKSLLAVNNSYSLDNTKGNITLCRTETQDNLENMRTAFEVKLTSDFICMPIHSSSTLSQIKELNISLALQIPSTIYINTNH